VPRGVVGGAPSSGEGNGGGAGQSALEALLAMLLSERAADEGTGASGAGAPGDTALRIRAELEGALGRNANGASA